MAREKLNGLIEQLRVMTLDAEEPSVFRSVEALIAMVDSLIDTSNMEQLTNDELRALKGFRITLYKARSMEPDAARLHVSAHYLGVVDQTLRKLFGADAAAVMADVAAQPGPGGSGA